MRKRLITDVKQGSPPAPADWLDIEQLAEVEITSEDPAYPIESALLPGEGSGWRAAAPGKQSIRILFTQPQRLRKIRISFFETSVQRTQEYLCLLYTSRCV